MLYRSIILELSRHALRHAMDVRKLSEDVVAVSVIPSNNTEYARQQGWLTDDEEFDSERIVSRLSQSVSEIDSEILCLRLSSSLWIDMLPLAI